MPHQFSGEVTLKLLRRLLTHSLCFTLAAMLLGFLAGGEFASSTWNIEWGPPFKEFYFRQRELVFEIRGATIGAVVGVIFSICQSASRKQTARPRLQFPLTALLLMTVMAAMTAFCITGYLRILNAVP